MNSWYTKWIAEFQPHFSRFGKVIVFQIGTHDNLNYL